jgi:hypothetical protein
MSDPNTRPDWFLVYIVSIRGSPHQLGIRIDSDKVGVDILDRFFPDVQSGLVQPLPRIHTIPKVVRELGWFENINIFGQICQAQAVPAGQQQNLVFDMWTSDVLQTITSNYSTHWIPNDG